jgi:predicted NBD/HSP70 family sugar kinase
MVTSRLVERTGVCPGRLQPACPVDEWSGDIGSALRISRSSASSGLRRRRGSKSPQITDAGRLKFVQEKLEAGHEGALKIWQSMGIYLGYGMAHYADFYDLKHVLILGRCTSGRGGELLIEGARQVLEAEFPELLERIELHLPDERIRRVGQSVAAASLPVIDVSQADVEIASPLCGSH